MTRRAWMLGTTLLLTAASLSAQEAGTASGTGVMDTGSGTLAFKPRYAYAYVQTVAGMRFTWIVLTEKQPPAKTLVAAADKDEARRQWCEKEKTPVAAVQLDPEGVVNQYMTCPANGGVNTEMLSTWNGLDSVALKFDVRDAVHLTGTMKTGNGSCPGPGGRGQAYCTATGDYAFDAPFVK